MTSTANINRVNPETSFSMPEDRLLTATRAWLVWLQGLFKNRPLGRYRWSPNSAETEIVITDQNPDEVDRTNKRPIISTARGPATWASTSMSQTELVSYASEDRRVIDMFSCSMTISVVAREGLEAQAIAYTIFRMIPVFRDGIARLGRMHAIGNQVTVSPETPKGQLVPGSSTSEWKMVQLTIPFYVQEVISVSEEDFHSMVRDVNLILAESSP